MRGFRCVALLGIGAAAIARGQALSPPGTGGVAALADALQQLGPTKRILVIGAHPDDEDSQLLALLSRGLGVQTAYLSLTRGEGGQNLIGQELGPALGLLRTEELLAARAVDGARQFFTRAYDFGYSRSAEEAFRYWPRDSLLRDVVAVIRRFRPQIIVSVFAGTPRDGHGQHQVAGLIARLAYDALRDSSWGPVKLYRSAAYDTTGTTLRLAAGALDAVAGQSYYQIAMASRSRHRSQDMGQLQRLGPRDAPLELLASRRAGGPALFAGVDTLPPGRGRYAALVDSARAALNPWRPGAIVPFLARALRELGSAEPEQRVVLERALAAAAGVAVDALADDDIVTAGQRVQVEATIWNTGAETVQLEGVELAAPARWEVEWMDPLAAPVAPGGGALVTRRAAVTVARDAPRTEPYFLRRPLRGALYDWSGVPAEWRGLPFEPPPLEARVRLRIAGESVTLTREVVRRVRDQAIGEVRRPLVVTQDFDVGLAPDLIVWPTGRIGAGSRRFVVTITNRTRGPAPGRLVVAAPSGWSPVPAERVAFDREDERRTLMVTVAPPGNLHAGRFTLAAAVIGADGRRSGGALRVIDYPHIRPRAHAAASASEIRAADIALPLLARVGYVRGASDRVPEALLAVGFPIEVIPGDSLAGDLSRYDAIVVGSRAYETDPALAARNGRLLEYARAGGLVVVQYQQYEFVQAGFAPYRLSFARPADRVTEESAPIVPLQPDHPLFHQPNALGPADWEGWVQERGLYFAHDWDSTYVALLETHDLGAEPLQGSLLVAPVGRGTYVYTGLTFFRQLPAGVPGAYRLFANLLALGGR